MKVTYNPQPNEPDTVEAFGRVFMAGEALDITDEAALGKLKGNPHFAVAGEKKPPVDDTRAKDTERLNKVLDGRTKEARAARAKADEIAADAEAKERAAAQVQALAAARAEAE